MPKCEIYQDVKREWRWRRTNKDGEILKFSRQGFEKKEDCEKNGKEEGACTSYKLIVWQAFDHPGREGGSLLWQYSFLTRLSGGQIRLHNGCELHRVVQKCVVSCP